MPRRSGVYKLPEAVRDELDQRIVASGFSRYRDHAAWLAGLGYDTIGAYVVARYAQALKAAAGGTKGILARRLLRAERQGGSE